MATERMTLLARIEDAARSEQPDLLREALEWALQRLMEDEVTERLGAAPHERSPERTGQRNGHRPRLFDTRAGNLELAIPKLRSGSYFPDWLLEPRRRAERALVAVIQEAYVQGVSNRRVDDLVRAMGTAGISRSTVSRMCAELDADLAAFRERRLDGTRYPYLWLDAKFEKVRDTGRVTSSAFLVAIAANERGEREVLGCAVAAAESEAAWTAFLRSLVARGLSGVRLVTSDAHLGVKAAVEATLLGAAWQRSSVHTRPRDHPVPTRPDGERLGSDDRSRSHGRPAPPTGGEAHTGPREMCLRAPNDERPGRAAPERGRSASGGRGTWRSSSASTGASSTTRSMRWTRRVACGSSCGSAMTELASRRYTRRSPHSARQHRSGSASSGERGCSSSTSSPGAIRSTR